MGTILNPRPRLNNTLQPPPPPPPPPIEIYRDGRRVYDYRSDEIAKLKKEIEDLRREADNLKNKKEQDMESFKFYFTFGHGQPNFGYYVCIEASHWEEARKIMCEHFQNKWSMQYSEDKYEVAIASWGYKELKLPDYTPPINVIERVY